MEHATPEVLVVGAGPTGLVLALDLASRGVRVRIVDRKPGPTRESRAIAVQARTLELYDALGLAEEVTRAGVIISTVSLRHEDRELARATLRDAGRGITPFSSVVCYPQDEHERLLVDRLARAGVAVEWGTEATAVREGERGVDVELGGRRTTFPYVCGCDGGHSAVRSALHLDFSGGSYEHLFFVADAEVPEVPDDEVLAAFGKRELALIFPVRRGRKRVIGMVPDALASQRELTFELLRPYVERALRVRVGEVHWFSTYKVHHRVASRFRVGRCFLLGDAGHVHSPVGGQGMNTGIGDALNLGWKLAHVLRGRGATALLDTYEPERIAFARALVATTDRVFQEIIGDGVRENLVRSFVVPRLLKLVDRSARIRRALFRRVGQLDVSYRGGLLGEGKAGRVHGGDRLPWTGENHAPLRSRDWQLHVYGAATPELLEAASALTLRMHELPWDAAAHEAGLVENAAYLVRPDGYVGLALPEQDVARLVAFSRGLSLRYVN